MAIKSDSTVLISTFSPWINGRRLPINGNLEPLLDFFVPKVKKTVLIDQVYPGSDFVIPRIEVYENHRKVKVTSSSWWLYILYLFLKLKNTSGTHIVFKIRDFLSVIDWSIRDKTKFDFFIGLEAINTLAGILLRKIGRIKTVIYYVSDYSPKRYKQKWFNDFYLLLDRYCAMHADYIWDVSMAIHKARIKVGLDPKKSSQVIHVPNALYKEQIRYEKLKNIKPYSLVFMGTLGVENGPDLSIEALPYVLIKYPKTRLHIVGGGNDLSRLKQLVRKLKLEENVVFHGFIGDRVETSKLIRPFMLALAPYVAIKGSPRFYGDATKIRAYLGAGLPVITTHVPPLGREIKEKGAGIIVSDNPKSVAHAIIKVFKDKGFFLLLRENAIKFAKDNTWDNEYERAFLAMEKFIKIRP